MAATQIFPLALWLSGTNQNSIPANDNALRMQALLGPATSIANAAPSSPAENQQHVVGTAWGGFATKSIVIYKSATWYEFTPVDGMFKTIGGDLYQYAEGEWAEYSASGGTVASIVPGTGITVDDTDPANPVVSATGGSTVNVTPDSHPSSPDDADDEFEYGSSIDTAGDRGASAVPWAWVNQDTATGNVAQGHLVLASPASTDDDVRVLVQAVSGSAWKYRAKLSSFHSANVNYFAAAMVLRDSGSGKLLTFYKQGSASTFAVGVHRWASPTAYNAAAIGGSDIFSGAHGREAKSPIYFEVELSAGVLTFRYSDTGVDGTFISIGTESVATYITAIDGIGVGTFGANANPITAVFDWFRKVA